MISIGVLVTIVLLDMLIMTAIAFLIVLAIELYKGSGKNE